MLSQPLPVVRVGEIAEPGERPALAGGRALGCVVGGCDRRRPQVRQDLAGAGHGPLAWPPARRAWASTPCRSRGRSWSTWPRMRCRSCGERIEGMARHRGLDLAGVEIHVITAPVLRLDRDPDRARLWETTRRLRPRLLLLDPLVRLHGIDENHAGEVAELLAYFRSLQRQLDLSVLLVHHTRKNAAGGVAAGQGLRGSGDIHAFGDSNLYLRRTREHLVLSSEHRAAPASAPVYLELVATDAETTHLEVDRGAPGWTKRRSLEERVLDLLAPGAVLTRAKLRDSLGVKNERLGEVLESLERAGRLCRTPAGWQRLD